MDVALVPQERSTSPWGGAHQWAHCPGARHHPREGTASPHPRGRRLSGLRSSGIKCPLPSSCSCPLPLVTMGHLLGRACPHTPQQPQLLQETLPGPAKQPPLSREPTQGKTTLTPTQAHPPSQGAPHSAIGREGWPAHSTEGEGTGAPRSHTRVAGLDGTNSHWS